MQKLNINRKMSLGKNTPFIMDKHKKHIEISLGMACNNKCIFCMNTGPRNFVPFEQVIAEAREYSEKGYNSVGFIGGDPTIYKRIVELGRQIRDMGFKHIHLITNGRRLRNIEFLDELIDAGFNRFSVSIHSLRPEVEDELTGVRGGWEHKIEGIENLVKRCNEGAFSDRVALNTVMNKMNVADLDTMVRFFSDIGITDMRLLIIRPEGRALENFHRLVPRLTEIREKLPAVIHTARRHNVNVMMDPPPFCLFYDIPGFNMILASDYIDDVVADAVRQERASFSWNEFRVRNKVKKESCAECCFDARCEGVWRGYVQEYGFEEFRAVTREDLSKIY